ncbi:MAG: recombinase family protein [Syntrophobacteraceae bacterium]
MGTVSSAPWERQKQQCIDFSKKNGIEESRVVFYTSRNQLFTDVERDRIARIVVQDVGRLAATPGDLEGALFELKMRKVDLLPLEGEVPGQKA